MVREGEEWLKDRRLIQPTFAMQQVQAFGETMVLQTAAFMEDWHFRAERDALFDMQTLTMSIAAETLLGVHLAEEVKAIHAPHDLIRDHFDCKMESVWMPPRWIPTPHNRRVNQSLQTITKIVDQLIAERREQQQLGPDILSRLLAARDQQQFSLTDAQIRDQAITFLFAGHETTASLLGWVWYLLAQHPHVEQTLHAELGAVLGGNLPSIGDVPKLIYTDKVIRETLRMYPSAYIMGREALMDMELGGYKIEAGSTVILSQWLMHRDDRFYPLEFDPDRWTDNFQRELPQFAWFPFGGGPRICIGNTFAMLEAVLVVATIASQYRLQLIPGQTITPHTSVTIRPSPGVKVRCRRRVISRSTKTIPKGF